MENFKNKSILIVDDVEMNIFALSSYLETLEVNVLVSKNGQEVMTLLQRGTRPDVILLDMMMPVMDGYETLKAIKENDAFKNIPVIAVTARAMKGDKEKCLDAGAWDYLSKPINLKLLNEKLTKLLDNEL